MLGNLTFSQILQKTGQFPLPGQLDKVSCTAGTEGDV